MGDESSTILLEVVKLFISKIFEVKEEKEIAEFQEFHGLDIDDNENE